ncbi:MAG: TraB/GumN family protein [Eubacteriaceae bacterium]|jgi:pheromone shutdown-related protein TraB
MENENNQQKNITRFKLGEGDSEREVILVGTAHVSPKSAELVREVIEEEQPDSVCIELDAGRFKAMRNKERYQNTDIVKIIKSGKAGFFFANLLLSSYQRRLADQFNIQSGQDMMQGIQSAEDNNAEIVLADRDIQTTFKRIWQKCRWTEKLKLLTSIVMSVFDDEEITEDALEELKQEDMLTAALSEMGNEFASVKTVLVDERDQYLAEKIKQAPGKKIVAVLGAAHVPGITQELFKNHNLEKLEELKPKSNTGKIVGWTVTIALILMVAFTFTVNTGEGWAQTRNWLLLVSGGAGLGALAAGGTFLTILTAIVCAPLGAISPVLASGWFSGLAEAHFRKPRVRDFEEIPKDLNKLSGLWKNRVTRILMVVVLTNIGCAIGNIAGGIGIIKGFMDALFI